MNVLERSQELANNMVELNKSAIKGHYGIQKKSVISAYEDNRERFAALREVKDFAGVIDAQREYYSAMQKNVTGVVRDQVSFARKNLDNAGQLLKAFVKPTTDSVSEVVVDAAESVSEILAEKTADMKAETVEAADEAIEEVSKTAEAVAEKAARKAAKVSKA